MLIPNPYATNGIVPPNRIVYDANGVPAVLSPNGMLTPINPNALSGILIQILENCMFDGIIIHINLLNFSANGWYTIDRYKWSKRR